MSTTTNATNINLLSDAQYSSSSKSTSEIWATPIPDASTSDKGIVQLATTSETTSMTETSKAVTPASLATVMATKATTSEVTSAVSTHNSSSSAHSTLFAAKADVRTTVADTTSTTATIASVNGNTDYTFSQALTSLTITAITSSMYDSNIFFTAGSSFALTLPNGTKVIGSTPSISTGDSVVISIKNGMVVIAVSLA